MANQEHFNRLQQGVEAWNKWREENSGVKLDLSSAYLITASLRGINLEGANLSHTYLRGANLSHANLSHADLSHADLVTADLSNTNLRSACLHTANVSGANLDHANLCGAALSGTQALRASFQKAILTGACIKDWNINSDTNLQEVICEYVFTKYNWKKGSFTDRRPHASNQIFAPGEFAALVQKSIETVDLVFIDGIDWKAFFQSFQQLQSKYRDENLGIQAIEKKPDGAFVIRLEVSPESDKAAIEQDSKSFYEAQLTALEAQYKEMLRLQGDNLEDARRTIEHERQEKAKLMTIVATMASIQGNNYYMQNSSFGGGFAAGGGTQIGGTLNDLSDDQDGSGA